MPLKKGYSKAAFDANVAELIRSGRESDQALAIAYKEQRAAQKRAGKRPTPRRK